MFIHMLGIPNTIKVKQTKYNRTIDCDERKKIGVGFGINCNFSTPSSYIV